MTQCAYPLENGLPPCLVPNIGKYKNLSLFVDKKIQTLKTDSVPISLECIKFNSQLKNISVLSDRCINCFACVFSCPGNRLEFSENYLPEAKCSDFISRSINENNRIRETKLNLGLTEHHHPISSKYSNFDEFTSVNETKNISVWAATAFKFIFGQTSLIGTEIPTTIENRDRDGRLDIGVLFENHLLVAESKISLKKMLSEGRYESQLIAYQEELIRVKSEKPDIQAKKVLLIGGEETDLLPASNLDCTSKVGNQSDIFYSSLTTHNFTFISAKALLAFSSVKLIRPNENIPEMLIDLLFDDSTVGLLSNLLIRKNNGYLEEIPLSI